MDIQWYPGHMTKTRRMLQEQLALVDVVVELLDARVPYSSRNPDIDSIARGKRRIIVLNKSDLADPGRNKEWEAFYKSKDFSVMLADSRDKKSSLPLIKLAQDAVADKINKQKARGRLDASVRAMVVGIPNVGKSTFINRLSGRTGAAAADRPGVTRGRQWINVRPGFDVLDTPGILWPKFDDRAVGVKLAATGAVSDNVLDNVTLCAELLAMLTEIDPVYVKGRYGVDAGEVFASDADTGEVISSGADCGLTLLEAIGGARGFKLKGGIIDIERAAITVLDEFRAGKLGRVTLEKASE